MTDNEINADEAPSGDASLVGMRVCWFGSARYNQPLNQTQARKWAALATLGAEMFVIGFAPSLRPRSFQQHAHFTLLPQARFSPLRHFTLLTLGFLTLAWALWRKGCRVFIAQSPYEGALCVLLANISRLCGRRTFVIVESHNDFAHSLFLQRRIPFIRIYRWLMRRLAGYALRQADWFRPVSQATSLDLKRFAPKTPQTHLIAWTDSETFIRAGRHRNFPPPKIVYAGILIPRKGIHNLLKAFAECRTAHPEASLQIIGAPANADYARGLRRRTQQLDLVACVEFCEPISHTDLANRFAEARASVLPSHSEGTPRVLLESQLVGTPVIATDVGGIPEIVREGETGFLVPADDDAALANALNRVLNLAESEWRKMSERARDSARQNFSTQAYIDGHREMLTQAGKVLP